MGRKADAERPKKGPGRKSRKQKDPVFTKKMLGMYYFDCTYNVCNRKFHVSSVTGKDDGPTKPLSHRQTQRKAKRIAKVQRNQQNAKTVPKGKKVIQRKQDYNSDESEEEMEEEVPQLKANGKNARVKQPIQKEIPQNSEGESDEYNSDSDEEDDIPMNGFTDDNSEWLKPKQKKKNIINNQESEEEDEEESDDEDDSEDEEEGGKKVKVGKLDDLFADSDENEEDDDDDDDEDDEDDDDDEDEDDDDLLPIEKANKKLQKRQKVDTKMAEDELQDNIANKEKFEFPDDEAIAKTTNIQEINLRIRDIITVLSDFKANRDDTKSRQDYLDLLKKDLCTYYSYNEFLIETFMTIFPLNELVEFLEASETQRPLTIRTNSLKTRRRDLAQALINRGVNLDPVGKWSKVGLVIYSSQVPLGATPEYLAGHYMIQGASSMLPVLALAPEEKERILDMCAAPGGKSSHIAALMKNTGELFSNDANRDRLHAVIGNFHRMGVVNSIVSCMDGTKYRNFMTGFDRVLLDAPCTGTGVIAKDPSVKTSKSETDIQRCYNLQRQLILSAIDCLSSKSKTGGYLVYSTCSVLPQENEWVIDYALKKRNVRLVETGLDFGTEGLTNYCQLKFHSSMKLTRRYYPHTHNMDGFFVAKLQKFSDVIPDTSAVEEETLEEPEEMYVEELKAQLPKRRDRRDWYYTEAIDKIKKAKEDPNHVVKVFEVPETKRSKKNKNKNAIAETFKESPTASEPIRKTPKQHLNSPKAMVNDTSSVSTPTMGKKTPSKKMINGESPKQKGTPKVATNTPQKKSQKQENGQTPKDKGISQAAVKSTPKKVQKEMNVQTPKNNAISPAVLKSTTQTPKNRGTPQNSVKSSAQTIVKKLNGQAPNNKGTPKVTAKTEATPQKNKNTPNKKMKLAAASTPTQTPKSVVKTINPEKFLNNKVKIVDLSSSNVEKETPKKSNVGSPQNKNKQNKNKLNKNNISISDAPMAASLKLKKKIQQKKDGQKQIGQLKPGKKITLDKTSLNGKMNAKKIKQKKQK